MSIVTLTFDLQINRVQPLTMVNMSAKFDKEIHNGLVSTLFTSLFPYMSIVTLTFDLQNQYGWSSHHGLYVCQVWSWSSQWFCHYGVHKLISIYVHCDLDLWPLTFKINRVHPLTMVNMSAKFDKEIHNGLVSIVFTSLFSYMSIVTLTFDLWPPKSIGFILLSWLTCLPSLTKKYATVYCFHKVHARTDGTTHWRTDGTTAALLYPHRNALCGDNDED